MGRLGAPHRFAHDRARSHQGPWGESFRFVVNGRPVFLPRAPTGFPRIASSPTLSRADYARDLRAAAAANMNMRARLGRRHLRERGFLRSVRRTGPARLAGLHVRLHAVSGDNAFLALLERGGASQLRGCVTGPASRCGAATMRCRRSTAPPCAANATLRAGYEKLFHEVLARAVAAARRVTPYWPSSSVAGHVRGRPYARRNARRHALLGCLARAHPVKDYEKWPFRFVSEFGMQSYSSPETRPPSARRRWQHLRAGDGKPPEEPGRQPDHPRLRVASLSVCPRTRTRSSCSRSSTRRTACRSASSTTAATCRAAWARSTGSSTTAGRSPRGARSSSPGAGRPCITSPAASTPRPWSPPTCPATRR
jgi:hypothetical protein